MHYMYMCKVWLCTNFSSLQLCVCHIGQFLLFAFIAFFLEQLERFRRQLQLCKILELAARHDFGRRSCNHKFFDVLKIFWIYKLYLCVTSCRSQLMYFASKLHTGVRHFVEQHRYLISLLVLCHASMAVVS